MNSSPSFAIAAVALAVALQTDASAYVFPRLGGGQANAAMKHADISFDGSNLAVHIDPTVPTPLLRPLIPPDEFDPVMPWSVLQGKAHNFQYGWNPSGFWAPPVGTAIWIEQISASPGLEVYFVDGLPASVPYDPLFGTKGSASIWKWSGAMTHNAYAVLDPIETSYEANYKVYIGDEITGEAVLNYGSALATFEFIATPVLTADFNDDGFVDGADLTIWQDHYGLTSGGLKEDGDTDHDGDVDGRDFLAWQRQVSTAPVVVLNHVPEPSGAAFLTWCLGTVLLRRR